MSFTRLIAISLAFTIGILLTLGQSLRPVSAAGEPITPGALKLTATYQSIGIELPFTGDADASATARLELKKASDTTWRAGLPLWRTDDGGQRAFYGSALLLTPGASYNVRVTVQDADGVVGSQVLNGSISTRTDAIPSAASLSVTRYVRANGDDARDGGSPSAAWRTLDKALKDAPAGAVVQVGPGYYARPATTRAQPLTLVAQYPAVDDARTPINAGRRSVVEGGPVSSPTGSGEPNAGVWQQVTLVGPGRAGAPAGATYKVWKWSSPTLAGTVQLGYAATRGDAPQRIAVWKSDTADLATPAGWAEKLFTNQTYNYGAYVSGSELYLRLPPNAPSSNPNTLYISTGAGSGLTINAPGSRVSGLEIRQSDLGIQLQGLASGSVVDHNLVTGTRIGVYLRAQANGTPSAYAADHTIQRNRIVDANLWTDDHTARPAIPWGFVKGKIVNANGSTYATSKLGEQAETVGISGRGGAQRVVARHNTIEGTFNGINPGYQAGYDRYAGMDLDVHGNVIRRIADDALEPEAQVINFRAWGNRIEHASTFISTGPVNYGPLFIFRNEAWRIGNAGAGRDNTGVPALSGRAFKYSGTSSPAARVYVLHNTIWIDQATPNTVDGGGQSASSGPSPEAFYLRNNVFGATKAAFEAPTAPGRWDEDYNFFGTTATTRGLRFGSYFTTDVAAYRAASGQGAHTNRSGSFVTPPSLSNPANGDLSLPYGSSLIDAGVPVPNVSDRAGVDYAGAAPDLGARER